MFDYIEPEQIKEHKDALIIDVRDADYDMEGHHKCCVNIPMAAFNEKASQEKFEASKSFVVFCMMSRQRAVDFAEKLSKTYPHKKVYVVKGGFMAIKEALPAECECEEE